MRFPNFIYLSSYLAIHKLSLCLKRTTRPVYLDAFSQLFNQSFLELVAAMQLDLRRPDIVWRLLSVTPAKLVQHKHFSRLTQSVVVTFSKDTQTRRCFLDVPFFLVVCVCMCGFVFWLRTRRELLPLIVAAAVTRRWSSSKSGSVIICTIMRKPPTRGLAMRNALNKTLFLSSPRAFSR